MSSELDSSSWPIVRLTYIQAPRKYALNGGPFGSKLVSRDYKESGVPVIRGTNLAGEFRFSFEEFVFVSEEKADELRPNNAHPGDLIFTQRGTLGQVGYIPKVSSYPRFVISQSQMKLTVDETKAEPLFIYYYFTAESTVRAIHNLALSSGVPHINLDILRNFELPLPPLPVQRKIADILSAYDDLIENNTRRIQILEEMAQSLYREWFVHFRFPGHEGVRLVESELGLVPEGWEVKNLHEFGGVVTGKTPSKAIPHYFGSYMPFIKTPDMYQGIFCLETSESLSIAGVASQKNKTLPANSICVSCIGTAGVVAITTKASQTNQQINTIVLSAPADREFLYFALLGLREVLNQYGANGATMVNVNKGKFESLSVLYPTREVLGSFHDAAVLMFEQIRVLQTKNVNLHRTRDLLLPKLISGEVHVAA